MIAVEAEKGGCCGSDPLEIVAPGASMEAGSRPRAIDHRPETEIQFTGQDEESLSEEKNLDGKDPRK